MRPETKKLLQENTGSYLFDTGLSNIFLNRSPEARETKAKFKYWDHTKIKNLCTAKGTINKMTRQPTEQEKMFINDTSPKGLISKTCKELTKLNTQNTIWLKNGQRT